MEILTRTSCAAFSRTTLKTDYLLPGNSHLSRTLFGCRIVVECDLAGLCFLDARDSFACE